MAKKIKFALEMADGVKVRSGLEELREHFDLERVVGYFLSGKLVEWLEDRFYEEEAEKIGALDKDAPDFHRKLCTILGVDYDTEDILDVEFLERLNEKRAILREKTADKFIIDNADKTALNQEDLADLLEMGEDTIYLYGKHFTLPLRYTNKKYIGILGTPKISTKAKEQIELTQNAIITENVLLPWENKTSSNAKEKNLLPTVNECPISIDILKQLMKNHLRYGTYEEKAEEDRWWAVAMGYGDKNCYSGWGGYAEPLTKEVKAICLRIICQDKYTDNDILHMHIDKSFTYGWALTKDSFCSGGIIGTAIIPYTDIADCYCDKWHKSLYITTYDGNKHTIGPDNQVIFFGVEDSLPKFLLAVRDFIHGGSPVNKEKSISSSNFVEIPNWMTDSRK